MAGHERRPEDVIEPAKAEAIARGEDTFPTAAVAEPADYPRPTTVVAVVFGVVALIVVGVIVALLLTARAQDTADANTAERDRARVVACAAYNVDLLHVRTALKKSLLALVPAGTVLTAEQKLRVDAYGAAVDASLAYRDCSPEGIAAFYATPPVDPAKAGG